MTTSAPRRSTINSLISTSVSDCKTTLEGMVKDDAFYGASVAITLLQQLKGKEGQVSRRKVAAGVLRKAAKILEAGL